MDFTVPHGDMREAYVGAMGRERGVGGGGAGPSIKSQFRLLRIQIANTGTLRVLETRLEYKSLNVQLVD